MIYETWWKLSSCSHDYCFIEQVRGPTCHSPEPHSGLWSMFLASSLWAFSKTSQWLRSASQIRASDPTDQRGYTYCIQQSKSKGLYPWFSPDVTDTEVCPTNSEVCPMTLRYAIVTLICSSELCQDDSLIEQFVFQGIVEPHSLCDIPLIIEAQMLEEDDIVAYFSIFGSPDPPLVSALSISVSKVCR